VRRTTDHGIRAHATAIARTATRRTDAPDRTTHDDPTPEHPVYARPGNQPRNRLDAAVASAPSEWRFWDAATQTYLLMEAAGDGGPARIGRWPSPGYERPVSATRATLDELRASLRFKPGAGGPDGFDPAVFNRNRAAVPYGRPSAR